MRQKSFSSLGFVRHHKQTRRERLAIFIVMTRRASPHKNL
jgi:hypothetical protein